MKRYAFVDVDMTIVSGNLGAAFAKELLKQGPKRAYMRNPLRFVLYLLKSVHVVILYPFSWLYPVYVYLQDATTDRFFDLIESWRPELADRAARRAVSRARIPEAAVRFLQKLHADGYSIVLLSASPTLVLKYLADRLPVPVDYVGIDDRHREPFFAHVKARIIEEEFGDGIPALVVGNPRREPFWLARERAVVVRKPEDLSDLLPSKDA